MALVGTSAVAITSVASIIVGGSYQEPSVGGTATERTVSVDNTGANPVRIGGSNVTGTTGGVQILAGATRGFTLHDASDYIYAASTVGTTLDVLVTGQ